MRLIALFVLLAASSLSVAQNGAEKAQAILTKHCFACHGKDTNDLSADLNLFDAKSYLDPDQKAIVAGKPAESKVVMRMNDTNDPMPPRKSKNPISEADRKVIADWIAGLAPGAAVKSPEAVPANVAAPAPAVVPAKDTTALAAAAKEVFRSRCLNCHNDTVTKGGVRILDHALLLSKKKIIAGDAENSRIVKLMSGQLSTTMPPTGQQPPRGEELDAVRRWITAGAPAFPPDATPTAEPKPRDDVGSEYAMQKILAHVRSLPNQEDRRFQRYFSLNHILAGGATEQELQIHRDALAKAVNHLSLQSDIYRPKEIDSPANTVYAIDVRKLGWHVKPYEKYVGRESQGQADFMLYDIALLEYPYGIAYEGNKTYDDIMREYIVPAGMVRPIPYLRADWFVSTITLPPYYEDFLRLPFTLPELEAQLDVDSALNLRDFRASRAGMTVSGVSRNNRVVERHPARNGFYWKSFDFKSNRGRENMFKDPLNFGFSGGEMIFSLPNGLNGYYICDSSGNRLELAPTEIVTDKFSSDKIVRNGLHCMRCHDEGMQGFQDNVRPVLDRLGITGSGFDLTAAKRLYPTRPEMEEFVLADRERFLTAMTKVLGRPQEREPLAKVSLRYIDDPLQLRDAAAELGYAHETIRQLSRTPALSTLGLAPLASEGVVRRDAWEEYFDQAVRATGTGVPIVPIDGISRRDYPTGPSPIPFELKTNKKSNIFQPGETMTIFVTNSSNQAIYIELSGTSDTGKKFIIADGTTIVRPNESYEKSLIVGNKRVKEQICVLVSYEKFPLGVLLRGKNITDRIVRSLFKYENRNGNWVMTTLDPVKIVKQTIDVETK